MRKPQRQACSPLPKLQPKVPRPILGMSEGGEGLKDRHGSGSHAQGKLRKKGSSVMEEGGRGVFGLLLITS